MGPLNGAKIIEMGGIGPGPFCGMLLADMGAEVVCLERAGPPLIEPAINCLRRGKRSIRLDLKSPEGRDTFLALATKADAVFEGFRPGVAERLGVGPDDCLALNPRLVYGRMTGWGQSGPLAAAAGHDINYVSLTGVIHSTGRLGSKPVPPVPPAGDFGGGAMFLAFGLVCAMLEARESGKGQVVDAAITDGSASLTALLHTLKADGKWGPTGGANLLDSGAPFYDVYETLDGKYISLGAIEPHFYLEFLERAGLDPRAFGPQNDPTRWPGQKKILEALFREKSRDEWCDLLEGTDVCFAPVLDLDEAPRHAHNRLRGTYIELDGMVQPAPAPRFSRTVPEVRHPPQSPGTDTDEVLRDWGIN